MEAIAAAGKGRIFLTRGADFFALAPHAAGVGVGVFRTARTAVFGTVLRTAVLNRAKRGTATTFKPRILSGLRDFGTSELQTANCELRTANFGTSELRDGGTARLRIFKLQTSNFKLQTANGKRQTANFGLRDGGGADMNNNSSKLRAWEHIALPQEEEHEKNVKVEEEVLPPL